MSGMDDFILFYGPFSINSVTQLTVKMDLCESVDALVVFSRGIFAGTRIYCISCSCRQKKKDV